MHKHIHLYEAVLIFLILGSVGFFSATELRSTKNIPSKSSVATESQKPEFTTVVSHKLNTTLEKASKPDRIPKPAGQQDSNPSAIVDIIEFEENEYTALLTPNDPQYPLWFWDNIEAPAAWDIQTGSSDLVIAVIDSGFALNHQELADGWYINSGEQGTTNLSDACWDGIPRNKQSNGCDDDQNGYTDDWRGWDFYSIDNNPQTGVTNPNGNGVTHGSLVSGLVGASANNNLGFTGLDWGASIMPLQALSDDGSGFTSDIVAAIEYAVNNGADVINMSLGGAGDDPAMQAAVSYARSQNVVVVAASGNCATLAYSFCSDLPAPGRMGYPASYQEVIAVGAVNSSGNRASFSSYGPELDVVAPGQYLSVSTSWSSANQTSLYASSISGTSFSSPIVAGLVGLIKASDPTISNDSVVQLLKLTATGYGQSFNPEYGYGLIDAESALLSLSGEGINGGANRQLVAPSLSSSSGQNPSQPLSLGTNVTSTVSAKIGDTLSITARNINTGQKVDFQSEKSDDNGTATYSWDTNFLGSGAWRLSPNSQELSGIAETIYIN